MVSFLHKNQPSSGQHLKIIIVGCGKIGRTLVQQLSEEGHEITVIDKNGARLQQVTNFYDVMGIEGNGASYETLQEAGIKEADLFIAVTSADELNLLCCTIAGQEPNCSTIARVRAPEYSAESGYLREKLGLAMIMNPDLAAAREMARILYLPSSLDVTSFAHGQGELVKFRIGQKSPLDGLLISEIGRKLGTRILIAAVERNGEVYIPSGNFRLKSGDMPCLVSTPKQARDFLNRIGEETRMVKTTMIIGGGRSSYYLADQLIHAGVQVKIIETNHARCEELSEMLPSAIIINGDGSDTDILREEGIESVEGFVPLTGIDEENVVLTLHAKKVSPAKVITKITRGGFEDVFSTLDLGSVVYPKYVAAEGVVAYARAKMNSMNSSNIESLYYMYDQRVEAIEFQIKEESTVTNVPLKDLKTKDNLLIASITRSGKTIFPSGADSIQVGDQIMIITTHHGLSQISDILQ